MKMERLYAAHRKGALTITLIFALNILNGEELEKSCPAFSVRPPVCSVPPFPSHNHKARYRKLTW